MIVASPPPKWQDIGWNGIVFKVPSTWQPTVIYPTYLFFEQDGKPVFEIKWQKVQGKFSLQNGLKQLQKTLPENATLVPGELQPDMQQLLFTNTAIGFQIENEKISNDGMVLYCNDCKQVILVQWYFNTGENKDLLAQIFQSLRDHSDSAQQLLAIYDIQAKIPSEATLQSHELLPGRYTFYFELGATNLTLYRFKPAAIILKQSSLGTFGYDLIGRAPQRDDDQQASWSYKLHGLGALLAKFRRKPTSIWMRLWHEPDQNVILGVKTEGNELTETGWLENICKNFISVNHW